MTDKLKRILERCKCSVGIEVNAHRDIYKKIDERYLIDERIDEDVPIGSEIWNKMIETDTLVSIQVYPDTPIGFYRVVHYDLDMALDEIIEALGQRKPLPLDSPI